MTKYPFAVMAKGDSCYIQYADEAYRCYDSARQWCRRWGGKFLIRQWRHGYRVWCIEGHRYLGLGGPLLYPIEHGVPIPRIRSEARKYPFAELKVGDSFWAPKTTQKLGAAAHSYKTRNGGQFKCRAERGGSRCWRVR